MLRLPFRRSTRRLLFRALLLITFITFSVDFLSLSLTRHRINVSTQNEPLAPLPADLKVFIASIHWNNEAILRSHWNRAVLDLVSFLGTQNVYISILESGSWDDSKGALRELDAEFEKLGVGKTIILEETTHADEIAAEPSNRGWIDTRRGKRELRRIPYLSRLRNRSLEPLTRLAQDPASPIIFDRILFLNDVVFTTIDIHTLLLTHSSSYSAACSIDFAHPPAYYDTFALRDSLGLEPLISHYPYFSSPVSRRAILANSAVPVQSCWNGVVAFDAAPFYNASQDAQSQTEGLRFRGIPDSLAAYHLEGSECCLIHADNSLSAEKGVYVNPAVRVGYSGVAYDAVHFSKEQGEAWPGLWRSLAGVWRVRFWKAVMPTWLRRGKVEGRIRRWVDEGGKEEGRVMLGEAEMGCLVDEMQVLVANGWAHV
ncbi:MAG: hypothetical protein Q9220_000356 [cf. Caloplaca sp. 1 TL-2023]